MIDTNETTPQLSDLDHLPNAPQIDIYIWIDHIELICLVSEDREISKADIVDRFRERIDDLGEGEDTDPENDEIDIHNEPDPAAIVDNWNRRINDWFRHMQYRKGAFSESYPFDVEGDLIKVKENLTVVQKLYVYLLLAANLRYLKSQQQLITGNFEMLSCEVLKSCMPTDSEVHIFGTAAREGAKFTGRLRDKIKRLATEINENVVLPEEKISTYDTGDNGLDIVAWLPLGDKSGGLPLAFGQCACTTEWDVKQHSCEPGRWRKVLSLTASPAVYVFIPCCFRDGQGEWHKPQDIGDTVVIDRQRFVYLLRNKIECFEKQQSFQVIDAILAQRIS